MAHGKVIIFSRIYSVHHLTVNLTAFKEQKLNKIEIRNENNKHF